MSWLFYPLFLSLVLFGFLYLWEWGRKEERERVSEGKEKRMRMGAWKWVRKRRAARQLNLFLFFFVRKKEKLEKEKEVKSCIFWKETKKMKISDENWRSKDNNNKDFSIKEKRSEISYFFFPPFFHSRSFISLHSHLLSFSFKISIGLLWERLERKLDRKQE